MSTGVGQVVDNGQTLVNVNCERPLALSRAKKAIIHVMKRKLAQAKKKPMEPVMTVDLSQEENIFFAKTLKGSNNSWMQPFNNQKFSQTDRYFTKSKCSLRFQI